MQPLYLYIALVSILTLANLSIAGDPETMFSSGKVLIAAHRGGYETQNKDKSPENSAVNVETAIKKGYEVFETDLRVTKDGVFVVVHDAEISLETTGQGAVEDQNWAELKMLKKRYRNRGKDKSIPGPPSNERIATFEELLKQSNQRIMFKVDLKDDAYLHFSDIINQVEKHNMLEWTIFRVRYPQREFFNTYRNSGKPLSKNTLMFKVYSTAQVDRVIKEFNPSTIEITMKEKSPQPQDIAAVKHANAKGLLVEQHTGKTKEDWAKQIEAGVRMFHTTSPANLKTYLIGRGLSFQSKAE